MVPELSFQVTGAAAVEFAAIPTIGFTLAIKNAMAEEEIQSISLRCQIQLEVGRRSYSASEKEKLADLFGDPSRWGQTLRPMLWTHIQTTIPSFRGECSAELHVPCTFDFNVATTKYFNGLDDGEIPLSLLFSGTVFQLDKNGVLRVSPIPWDKEARFRLPVSVWRQMMDFYYPNVAWLCLQRDAFESLLRYKIQSGIPTWEKAIDRLLAERVKGVTV